MRIAALLRAGLAYLPCRSPHAVARALTLRANAARDAGQWQIAASLYQEAARFAPDARIHKQCGHMFKEAGFFDAAEQQYREATRLDPTDADLALQIGHFEKMRGDLAGAQAAYERALELTPGWIEPRKELARLSDGLGEHFARPMPDTALAPELLASEAPPEQPAYRETIQVRRLGAMVALGPQGYRRVLRGVEAVRGFCIATAPLSEVVMLADHELITSSVLKPTPLADGRHTKYVFNIWHDFSKVPLGQRVIELRFLGDRGAKRTHRSTVEIAPPLLELDHPGSDAVVELPPNPETDIERHINARPSIIRPAERRPLSSPRTILAQRVDQLGDLVVSVPALQRLRGLFPSARIVLLVSGANADFARTLECVDEVVVADVRQPDGMLSLTREAQQALATALAEYSFDLAIDLSQGAGSRALLRLANASFRYGFRTAFAPWLSGGFDLAIPDPVDGLETCSPSRKLVAMVETLGVMATEFVPQDQPARSPILLDTYGIFPHDRFVVLHTGTRLAMNQWPGFDALARLIVHRTDIKVVILGAPVDNRSASGDRLRVLTELLPFDHFDALVSSCSVFVGNDSGPKHLAALRGTPTISLHLARLNWNEWGQEGRGSIISRRVPCAGCAIEQAEEECGKDFSCLRMIQPEEVFAEVVRLADGPAFKSDLASSVQSGSNRRAELD